MTMSDKTAANIMRPRPRRLALVVWAHGTIGIADHARCR
jgi:hypothetical protein